MTTLFKKLNYKGQQEICIIDSPEEFADELEGMQPYCKISTEDKKSQEITFVLSFVKSKSDIDKIAKRIDKKLMADAVVWYAYPKKSSKKYKVEINRDRGWDTLGKLGYEGVRAVAIDEDWSAVRFRKVDFIKVMTRDASWALTKKGKAKTK